MNILLIGFQNDISFVYQTIKEKNYIKDTLLWGNNSGPDVLNTTFLSQYDCIILAIKNKKFAADIYSLVCHIAPNTKIINFYQLYYIKIPPIKVDKVMQNSPSSKYNGVILGISHAEVGLIPRCFDASFCNLALSSQDIYFNLKAFEYCLSQYSAQMKNLEYIIFDLYDYIYFNFDTSLSKNAGLYYCWGGILEPHNFSKNKLFQATFDELVTSIYTEKYASISDEILMLWDNLFPNIYTDHDYLESNHTTTLYLRTNMIQEKDIDDYYANTSIVKNIYHDTIQENIKHFYAFLDMVYKVNPKMKLYFVLLPRYYYAQQRANALYPQYSDWKKMFYTILSEANKIYPFTFLDLKEHEISKELTHYYDVSHFNYYGTVKFSKLLNTLIK